MTQGCKYVVFALVAATPFGLLSAQHQAAADVLSCPKQDGAVRVWDRETNHCGILDLNNLDWRFIGWNDLIDNFGNDDFIHNRTMCLFQDIQYRGPNVALPPGFVVTWNNTVSSNHWTTSGCVSQ